MPTNDFGHYHVEISGTELGTSSKARVGSLAAVVKSMDESAPFDTANEFVCDRLGLALGLPVPPGVLTSDEASSPAYARLWFGPCDATPPPADVEAFVRDQPYMAAGVVAFDCWIGNDDRSGANLVYLPPDVLVVFDHGQALWGTLATSGQIDDFEDPLVGGIAELLLEDRHLEDWACRIREVPEALLREVTAVPARLGIVEDDDAERAYHFLRKRQATILDLLRAAYRQGIFTSLHRPSVLCCPSDA
jgi:hypothetical protein